MWVFDKLIVLIVMQAWNEDFLVDPCSQVHVVADKLTRMWT